MFSLFYVQCGEKDEEPRVAYRQIYIKSIDHAALSLLHILLVYIYTDTQSAVQPIFVCLHTPIAVS